jgi:uncharacterized protein (TIGR02246 family)
MLTTLAIVAVLAAGQPASEPPSCGSAQDARAVRDVSDQIIAADNAGALETVMSFYAEDAVQWPPGSEPVRGRARIRPRYEALFRENTVNIASRIDAVCVSGDLATIEGRNQVRVSPRSGAAERVTEDEFLMVLRRERGSWRIAQLVWHPRQP